MDVSRLVCDIGVAGVIKWWWWCVVVLLKISPNLKATDYRSRFQWAIKYMLKGSELLHSSQLFWLKMFIHTFKKWKHLKQKNQKHGHHGSIKLMAECLGSRHNRAVKIQYYQAIRPLACMVLKVFETSAEPVNLCSYCETGLLLERFLQFQNLKMLLRWFFVYFQ